MFATVNSLNTVRPWPLCILQATESWVGPGIAQHCQAMAFVYTGRDEIVRERACSYPVSSGFTIFFFFFFFFLLRLNSVRPWPLCILEAMRNIVQERGCSSPCSCDVLYSIHHHLVAVTYVVQYSSPCSFDVVVQYS